MDARIKSGHDEWRVRTHRSPFQTTAHLQTQLRNLAECFFARFSFISRQGKLKKVALTACMRKLISILNIMIERRQKWDAKRYAVS
jgi:hypothetical protein